MKTSLKRLTLLVLATALGALVATGCSTWRGFGKDMQDAGRDIENSGR